MGDEIEVRCVSCGRISTGTEYELCKRGWIAVSGSISYDELVNNNYKRRWYCPEHNTDGLDIAFSLPIRLTGQRN